MSALTLDVNGAKHPVDAAPEESLLSVLRERLSLTGTKYGCGEGQCGACTVLLDGRPVRSCRTKASEAAGRKIVTIEGLASGDRLHPVQAAFLDAEAFPVRLLHAGDDRLGGGAPLREESSFRRRHRLRSRRQRLPLRNVPAHRHRRNAGRARDEKGVTP